MVHATKENILMERKMVKELSRLLMAACTRGSSTKMKYQVKAFITGLTKKLTEDTGSKTKCMVKALSNGRMANYTKECLKMISAKVMESSPGKMAEFTTESGKTENRMVKVSLLIRKTNRGEVFGKVERILSG